MVIASIFGVLIPPLLLKSLLRILMGRIGKRMLGRWLILAKNRVVQIWDRVVQSKGPSASVGMTGLCPWEAHWFCDIKKAAICGLFYVD